MHRDARMLGARPGNREGQRRVNGLARGKDEDFPMNSVTQQQAKVSPVGPELFHYQRFYGALLWGCVHDRSHLVRVDGAGVSRWDCAAGLYVCDLGHLYRRKDDCSWERVADEMQEVA